MQKEDVQMLGFEIVAYAGEARSKFWRHSKLLKVEILQELSHS